MLFADIEFALGPGEALVVTGANGSGKTTLLRIVAGLTQPQAGRLWWRSATVAAFDLALRAETLYIGHAAALKDELSAEENLLSVTTLHGAAPARGAVREAIREWSLGDHGEIPARVLSQGQRRRISLARMNFARRRLWVLDEPTMALDASGVRMLETHINGHLAEQGIAVIATHQPLVLTRGTVRGLEL